MDIAVLFRILMDRKWILILIPLVAAIITFIAMSFAPQEYKSKAQISTGFTISNEFVSTDEGFNPRDAEIKFSNLMETMKSPLVIGLVSYNLMIHDLEDAQPFKEIDIYNDDDLKEILGVDQDKEINLSQEQLVSLYQNKLDSLKLLTSYDETERKLLRIMGLYGYDYESIIDNLSITRSNYSDYVSIEFLSEEPRLSAFVVNTLVEEFQRYNRSLRSERSDESVEYYAALMRQKKEELDEKLEALKDFKSTNQVLNFEAENESNVSQIADLQVKSEQARADVYRYNLAIQNINRKLNNFSQGGTGSTNAQLIRIKNKLNDLSLRYRNSGSTDQVLADSIALLRDMHTELASSSYLIDEGGQRVTKQDLLDQKAQLQIDLAVAQRNLASTESTLGLLKNNASGLASKEATIQGFQSEVDVAREDFIKAQESYNNVRNASFASGSSIKQVLFGQPAVNPESSKQLIVTALAWAISFALCLVSIVFIEFIDTSIKTGAQFEKLTGLELAGSINYLNPQNMDLGNIFKGNDGTEENKEVKLFIQLLRKLRYEIELRKAKTILVTSTKQDEGKSFLIISLAYSLSLIQKKILIIDTNFKNNTLTRMLVATPKFDRLLEANYKEKRFLKAASVDGDFEFEEESNKKEQYNKSIISPTSLKNIDIIGSRGVHESPAEILTGRNFKEALEEISSGYDYIFMEGASLNEYSDTKELVEFADVVLPLFSAQSSIKQLDRESIAYLKRLDGKLMGAVLNKVSIPDMEN